MKLTKKTTAPTFEDRLNSSHATADAAVSVVESIALDLEAAASEKADLITEIDAESARLMDELDRLDNLRDEAARAQNDNLANATKIRALISA